MWIKIRVFFALLANVLCSMSLHALFNELTAAETFSLVPAANFSRAAQRSKAERVKEMLALPPELQALLIDKARSKRAEREARHAEYRKRKRAEVQERRRVRARVEVPSGYSDVFMSVPTSEELQKLHADFIDSTSNTALASSVCIVCARQLPATQCTEFDVRNLPNAHLLERDSGPYRFAPKFEGRVLLTEHLRHEGERVYGHVCTHCHRALRRARKPKYALANGLWIGNVPHELRDLTLPEQMLLSLQFPRVYIMKLYPKDRQVAGHPEQLQRGMAGNLVSLACNVEKIVDMLTGNLLPRPPRILASVIAVSFVGTGRLPKKWLKETFRVRRRRVYEALLWLKNHNPLYADYNISEEQLNALPEDGIPLEIAVTLRGSSDVAAANAERETYVPGEEPQTSHQI